MELLWRGVGAGWSLKTPPVASLQPRAAQSGDDKATAWLLGESSHNLSFATTFSEAFIVGASSGAAAGMLEGFMG